MCIRSSIMRIYGRNLWWRRCEIFMFVGPLQRTRMPKLWPLFRWSLSREINFNATHFAFTRVGLQRKSIRACLSTLFFHLMPDAESIQMPALLHDIDCDLRAKEWFMEHLIWLNFSLILSYTAAMLRRKAPSDWFKANKCFFLLFYLFRKICYKNKAFVPWPPAPVKHHKSFEKFVFLYFLCDSATRLRI